MYLTDTFLDQYKDKEPCFGGNGLGSFVYLRTYSRWREDNMRREIWQETIERSVNHSMSLYQGPNTDLQKEAELLYDAFFNLKVFPAGRTLWIADTEASKLFGTSHFNCSFVVIDDITAFVDAFHLLMVGAGVGFRILPDDVNKLPKFNATIAVAHKPYHGKAKIDRIENTLVYEDKDDLKSSILIVVGDSKSGWVEALQAYLHAMQRSEVESIVINYDSVRPAGEILKTFGGRASGHQALKNMFRAIHNVIRRSEGKLKPINALDIMNHIGANVVVGGVRRTSQIALFDITDLDVLDAKNDMWSPDTKNYGQDQRAMSNNSIFFENKPTKEQLRGIFERIQTMGEPEQNWALM